MKKLIITGLMIAMLTSTVMATAPVPTLYDSNENVVEVKLEQNDVNIYWGETELESAGKDLDGVLMLPLRELAEAAGFEVTWNDETKQIELANGARWTSVELSKNAYFKNKMAPRELSKAPTLIGDKTYVPAEFFTQILSLGLQTKEGNIHFSESMIATHSGYIQEIDLDEEGNISRITISSKEKSEGFEDQTILNVSSEDTYIQRDIEVGNFINAITAPIMTMSLPGQTPAMIIY
jgi:hypothetical protein